MAKIIVADVIGGLITVALFKLHLSVFALLSAAALGCGVWWIISQRRTS